MATMQMETNDWTWGACIAYAARNYSRRMIASGDHVGAMSDDITGFATRFATWAHDPIDGDIRWFPTECVDQAFDRWLRLGRPD